MPSEAPRASITPPTEEPRFETEQERFLRENAEALKANTPAAGTATPMVGIDDPIFNVMLAGAPSMGGKLGSSLLSEATMGATDLASLGYQGLKAGAKGAKNIYKSINPTIPQSDYAKNLLNKTDFPKGIRSYPQFDEEFTEIINSKLRWLDSDEYLKRRMASTGETAKQVKKDVAKKKVRLSKTKISFDNDLTGIIDSKEQSVLGLASMPKTIIKEYPRINISTNQSGKSKLGTLEHEIDHITSPLIDRTGKSYRMEDMYPTLPLKDYRPKQTKWERWQNGPQQPLYLQKPIEQQVRFNRLNKLIRNDLGIKDKTLSTEQIDKWLTSNQGQQVYNPQYDDIGSLLAKYSSGLRGSAKSIFDTAGPYEKYLSSLKEAMNKAWGVAGVTTAGALGATQAQTPEYRYGGTLNRYDNGGEIGHTHEDTQYSLPTFSPSVGSETPRASIPSQEDIYEKELFKTIINNKKIAETKDWRGGQAYQPEEVFAEAKEFENDAYTKKLQDEWDQYAATGAIHPSAYPASGKADYVPFWASLMPGTPAVKGLGKTGNFVLDALNPLGGMGKTPGLKKALPSIKPKPATASAPVYPIHPNTGRRIIPYRPPNDLPTTYKMPNYAPLNKSKLTKKDVATRVKPENRASLENISDKEFKNTVLKPGGELVDYNTNKKVLDDIIEISPEEYSDIFNSRLDMLNEIIANNNTSGVPYKVTGLSPDGSLRFSSPHGEGHFGTSIRPGQWRGDVEDIADHSYYKDIPGIEMTNTGSGIFGTGTKARGTSVYESINEYLKKLDLGRVKSGFNSQTQSSKGLWEKYIKETNPRAVGYYHNPATIYGIMKNVIPAAGLGVGYGVLNDEQTPQYKMGGTIQGTNKISNFGYGGFIGNMNNYQIPMTTQNLYY